MRRQLKVLEKDFIKLREHVNDDKIKQFEADVMDNETRDKLIGLLLKIKFENTDTLLRRDYPIILRYLFLK